MMKGLELHLSEEKPRDLGLFCLEKRRLRGSFIEISDGARLFSVRAFDRTRDSGDKLKHRRVTLNVRKQILL